MTRTVSFPLRRAAFALAVAIGLGLYWVHLYRHTCFAVGGSDSSGYANGARALANGRLVAPIAPLERFDLGDERAPAFIPLGFVSGPTARTMAPLYPVGFSLHLAAAAALLGWETGPYLASPILALLTLVLLLFAGRELGLSPLAAAGAAVILAAAPVFVFQAIQPMSDVAAAFWCLAAIFAARRARVDARWAIAAGFAFGVAVLVRPPDLLLGVPLLFALPLERRSLLRFVLGGIPSAAILVAYNTICYGSALETGYGLTGHWTALAWSNFPAHFADYTRWTSEEFTPLVCLGWVAALFHTGIARRDRALLFSWFGVFFLFYCFYGFGDAWWYTRFLLPGFAAIAIGFLLVAQDLARAGAAWAAARVRRGSLAAAAITIAVAAVASAGFRNADKLHVLNMPELQASFPAACREAERVLPPGALVLSMQMSGALAYYTELTPVRWDRLDPASFGELRAKTEERGGRWFALMCAFEVPLAAPKVPGRWTFLGETKSVSLWRLDPP